MAKKKEEKIAKPGGIVVVPPQIVKLAELNFATYNPRKITREKMVALKASILRYGLVLDFVIQKKGNIVIAGHQRLRAMRELCEENGWKMPEEASARVLDVDDATAKKLNVTLNNVEGDFDPYKLGELYASPEVKSSMTVEDVIASGFSQDEITAFVDLTIPPTDETGGPPRSFAKAATLSIEFDTAANRDKAKTLLTALSEKANVKAGTVVLRALKATAPLKKKRAA